jgi:hypothetical protein
MCVPKLRKEREKERKREREKDEENYPRGGSQYPVLPGPSYPQGTEEAVGIR